MAWVDGRWLDRKERAERMNILKQRLRKLKELIDLGKATDHHIDMMFNDKEELKKLNRIHRAENDVAYFAYAYLSDQGNPENDDNIIQNGEDGTAHQTMEEMASIHREFFDLCDYVDHVETNCNLAIAAPRGHNKSGTFSNIFPLHQVVFRKRHYLLCLSETDTLSKKLIGWVNKQIKHNEMLRNDLGCLLHPQSTRNEKDNEEAFVVNDGAGYTALVEASSSGKALRGKRFGSRRPDMVLIDDPSSTNNEGTKEAREKLVSWFNSVVMPIGSKATAIVLVGTVVTNSGLLNHCLARKDFKRSFHTAIVNEPDFPELWQEYCEMYAKSEDMSEVEEFYQKNKELLERGVETAWEWRWSYRDLMHQKVNLGSRAFASEYLNRAISEDEQYFNPETFAYYRFDYSEGKRQILYNGEFIPLDRLFIVGSWDLALGRNSRSCYNATVIIGKDPQTGLIFVLDEYSSKEMPHIFMNIVIEKIRQWRPKVYGVETIGFQFEMYRQLSERLRIEGVYQTKLKEVKSHKSSKEERIESLEPLVSNKTLIFNPMHKMLLQQMEEYPLGDYVDSLDSCVISVDLAIKPQVKVTSKPDWF